MSAGLALLFAAMSCLAGISRAQESAQYLQNAIRDLRNINSRNHAIAGVVDQRRTDAAAAAIRPQIKAIRRDNGNVPQLHLTKGELAALYESAVAKGETVKLDPGHGPHIHAAVHEIGPDHPHPHHPGDDDHHHPDGDHHHHPDGDGDHHHDDSTGYYYYYYPLKSFIDEMTSHHVPDETHHEHHDHDHDHHDHYDHDHDNDHDDYHHHYHHETSTTKPQPQYHSHTHQHNVHITPLKSGTMMDGDKKPKALEPLFMAISGFIGMAVMFVLSILVLPKLNILKSRGSKPQGNQAEITNIARIALRAIEGKDCAERIACEMGKTARAFNLYDNRFVKLLRRMAPSVFRKQIDKVGKYTDKKHKCAAIKCKRKPGPANNNKKQPNNKPTNNNTKKQ